MLLCALSGHPVSVRVVGRLEVFGVNRTTTCNVVRVALVTLILFVSGGFFKIGTRGSLSWGKIRGVDGLRRFVGGRNLIFPNGACTRRLLVPIFGSRQSCLFRIVFSVRQTRIVVLTRGKVVPRRRTEAVLKKVGGITVSSADSLSCRPRFRSLFFVVRTGVKRRVNSRLTKGVRVTQDQGSVKVTVCELILERRLLRLLKDTCRLDRTLLRRTRRRGRACVANCARARPTRPAALKRCLLTICSILRESVGQL